MIGLVFPGQGSQKVGMGKDLFDEFPDVQALFNIASETVGYDLATLCFDGPEEELTRTDRAQPALLTMDIACHRMLLYGSQKRNIIATAGHSLGEYAALVAAGALTFEDSIRLVADRGRLMQQAAPGSMAAIMGLDRRDLDQCLFEAASEGVVVPANINSPGQVVISGKREAVEKAMELARAAGAKRATLLKVSGAFHSPLMQSAADHLAGQIIETPFQEAKIPVVTNADARPKKLPDELRQALKKQMTSGVLWEDTVSSLRTLGVETVVECGPGRVLSGLISRCDKNIRTLNVGDVASLAETRKALELQ